MQVNKHFGPGKVQPLLASLRTGTARVLVQGREDDRQLSLLAYDLNGIAWYGRAELGPRESATERQWSAVLWSVGSKDEKTFRAREDLFDLLEEICIELHQVANGPHEFALIIDILPSR